MSFYCLPETNTLERWLQEARRQASGKRQVHLAEKFFAEYEALKKHATETTRVLNKFVAEKLDEDDNNNIRGQG